MGYTHYWGQLKVLPRLQFLTAVEDCRRLCDALNIPLGDARGNGAPTFNATQICFNGNVTDGSWETFHVPRIFRPRHPHQQGTDGLWFNFCKTNRQPYDLCVQVCLIVLNHQMGSAKFKVASDGSSSDWNDARAACQRILGYGIHWGEDKLAPALPT